MSEMLKIEQAELQVGGHILFHDFNLDVKRGEWVCITGNSGCGKTSLLRAVLGFLPLDGGRILVDGERLDARSVHAIRCKTGYVPQELFIPEETVDALVRVPFRLKANRECPFSDEKLYALWQELGLERELMGHRVAQLSGGQRQRIILSSCLMLDKPLVLADEPTSALDGESVTRMVAVFRRAAERGAALLAVSHNRDFMAACDRVIHIE